MIKRFVMGIVALLFLAMPAAAQGISQKVAVCDPAWVNRCIAPTTTGAVPVTMSGSGTLASQVQGNVASGATDVGNPVKIGGKYNATLPTAADGQRVDAQSDLSGNLRVTIGVQSAVAGDNKNNNAVGFALAQNSQSVGLLTSSAPFGFNGASGWDRLRTIQGALGLNTGVGVQAVAMAGAAYSNIVTATTTVVKSGVGILSGITINTPVASATITIYDNTSATGTKIATITLPSTITGESPFRLTYDVAFATGLTIVTSGATDLTVTYR